MNSLTFENISFSYPKGNFIFKDLSFQFKNPNNDKGHIIALMGASGSGKSTLFKLILRSIKLKQGWLLSNPAEPIVSYLPQEAVLFEHLNPMENAQYFKNIAAYKNYFNYSVFKQFSKALGMDKVLDTAKSVNNLSGGQKQRIAALRALSIKPDILLLDEPTTGLDSDVKLQFLSELRHIVLENNILGIYITHHKEETELIADEVAYLQSEDNNSTKDIFIESLSSFVRKPPILEAYKVFNYPNPNVVRCKWENNKLVEASKVDENYFYIGLKQENISFSDDYGIDFKILNRNENFAFLQLSNDEILTVENQKITGNKILLTDRILKYSKDLKVEGFIANKLE